MSNFNDYIDSIIDETGKLAKDELKTLITKSKSDSSEFVQSQADNFERLTIKLSEGKLTVKGYMKLVRKLDVLKDIELLGLEANAKVSAQKLADGIQSVVIDNIFKLL